MKAKKVIALLTASAMAVMSTSTVFAADVSSLNSSVSQNATVDYIDPTGVFSVTVPTNTALAFTLDPQNLAATMGVAPWNPSGGGTILPSSVVTFVNKGALPVKTSVALSVVDESTDPAILVDNATDINVGTAKNMNLTVTPANAKTTIDAALIAAVETTPEYVQDGASAAVYTAAELTAAGVAAGDILAKTAAATATFGQFVCVDDAATDKTYNQVLVPVHAAIPATTATTVAQYNATTGGLASTANAVSVTSDGANLVYVMDAAQHYIAKSGSTYTLTYRDEDTNTNYDTASFIIGGSINKNADWSGYTVDTTIAVTATYTFESLTDDQVTAMSASKLAGSHNSYTYVAPYLDPTYFGATTTKDVALNATTFSVPFDLGTGTKAVTITGIQVTAVGQDYGPVEYTYADGTLTFATSKDTEGFIAYVVANAATYPLKVTTSDSTVSTINIVVQ